MDDAHKGDRVTRSKAFTRAGSAIAVELAERPISSFVTEQEIFYLLWTTQHVRPPLQSNPAEMPLLFLKVNPPAEEDLPEGCERL